MIDHVVLHCDYDHAGRPAICSLFEERTGRLMFFGVREAADTDQLRQRLFIADWVSGFGLNAKAYPAIWGQTIDDFRQASQFRPLKSRTNDLLDTLIILGCQNVDLGDIALGTLGRPRLGDGSQSGRFLADNNWPALATYAADGCIVTRDLIAFANRYGYVVQTGTRVDIRQTTPRVPMQDQFHKGEDSA